MSELQQVLSKITALQNDPEPYILKQLIQLLRVPASTPKAQQAANKKIGTLIDLIEANPAYAVGLATFILTLLNKHHRISIFTDTGITDYGFLHNLLRLIGHRFIPLLPDDNNIIELVDYLFDGRHDELWLASIDVKLLEKLVALLNIQVTSETLVATAKNNILEAMVILSYRINGLGLHQELMKTYPEMLDYSAAFVAQNQETLLFAKQYHSHHLSLEGEIEVATVKQAVSAAPLLVMLAQCNATVSMIRKRIYKTGISIRLTNMLLRLEQSIGRLRNLSELLSEQPANRHKAIIELTRAVIASAKRRYSIRYLISINTELLSRKITENAGRVGEHYISTDKAGYNKMFKMAAIGGFVIAFMATLKILAYDLELAPMGRAFVNSMIYGLGFVFIHIIHGTVATKQPAMTAAAIASTISTRSGKKSDQLAKLSELMVDILRTQFIAIVGNVMIAMPLALIISLAWLTFSGAPMIGFDKAEHLLDDLNPFTSLALLHAAIAGVYLFLSGLIAGFYDNLAVFNHIGERIGRHKLLRKIMPIKLTERLGRFIEANLGAIMGNFLFGVFLGSTATIGYLFGLPLDIRHIAFASANFAHGLFNMPVDMFSVSLVLVSLLGVMLIGVINLLVSFSLALIVALRSKGVTFNEWKTLSKLLFNHLMTHTRDFFLPRDEPMQYTYIDRSGQMIHQDSDTMLQTTLQAMSSSAAPSTKVLADIRVLPEGVGINSDKVLQSKQKKKLQERLQDPTATAVNPKPDKQVVLSDPTDAAMPTPTGNDKDALLHNAQPPSPAQPSVTQAMQPAVGAKKEPLPKPKKPPNLPH